MKKRIQRTKLSGSIILFTILLISSFTVILASPAIDEHEKESLPPYLLKLSERFAEGNATRLALIRKQMIAQLKRNREMMPAEGNVLKTLPSGSRGASFIDEVDWIQEYHGGDVWWEDNIIGDWDYAYTHLHTDEPNAEAWVACWMESSTSGGGLYLCGKKGLHSIGSGWYNTVWAAVSNDTEADYEDWDFINFVNMTYSFPLYYYLGNYAGTFSAVIVGCYSWYESDNNCVYVDMFQASD